MKVLLLAPSLASPGGIQRYTSTLLRALQDELGRASARCIAIPGNGNSRLSATAKLGFAWQAISEASQWKPDLILCTHLALGPIARLIGNIARHPYWIVVHGIEFWGELPAAKSRALRQADRVIVTNAFNCEQLIKTHHVDRQRVATLPCTWDEALLTVAPSNNGYCSHLRPGQPVVLTVGRMAACERYKGHDVVLRSLPAVLAKVQEVAAVFVGDGDDRPRLEQLARDLGIAEHVVFTGAVSDSQLAALYRRSNLFVLPARTVLDSRAPQGEGFGIVYLEAMAFGNPVIGPNYGAPAELIRDGETGLLVDPDDPASVGDAMVKLLINPALASQMGKAASAWVQTNFSYACFRQHLRNVLESNAPASKGC